MSSVVPFDARPNRDRALQLIEQMCGAQSAAQTIATTTAAAVREAVAAAVPYSSQGANLSMEMELQHTDASGSKTAARFTVKYGRGA